VASRLRKLRRALISPEQWAERVATPRREREAAAKAAGKKLRRLTTQTAAASGRPQIPNPWKGRGGPRF
jgi:hypothetical protein